MGSFVHKLVNCHENKIHELTNQNADYQYLSFKSFNKDQNQDAALIIGYDQTVHIWVVIDGMGGHQGGEKATLITLESIEEAFSKKASFASLEVIRNTIFSSLLAADKKVKELKIGAGATFVATIFFEDQIQFLNSGDAKGYFLGSKGKLKFETVEHSPAGYYKEAKGEAADNIEDNIISNGIGFEPMSIEVSQVIDVSNHDVLLLCSDGLFHIYPESDVSQWGSSGKFETRTKELLELIEKTGFEKNLFDDTTIILSRFKVG